MSNRISYFLDIHGPSMTIDTGCSASLVCLHNACQALRSGEIDMVSTGLSSLHCSLFLTIAGSCWRRWFDPNPQHDDADDRSELSESRWEVLYL